MPTTLIAVSGMSPAIITETLWALANEHPATVPDEVVVITTTKGRADIERDLLTKQKAWNGKTAWETLRNDIFALTKQPKKCAKLQVSVRVIDLPDADTGIRKPAEDLRTKLHNEEAANFIVQTIAPFVDAEDQHVIASIAGGRKTMGALLYAAMSLLGKESDRVTHVLVSEPFDTVRGFFYPAQEVQDLDVRPYGQEPQPVKAKAAKVELADIPFVPLRNKFSELNEPRRTFAGLVDRYAKADRVLSQPPNVTLDVKTGVLTVEGKPIPLMGRDFLICAFLFERASEGMPHFNNKDDAKNEIKIFSQRYSSHKAMEKFSSGEVTVDDIPKALSPLRDKLKKAGLASAIPYLAPARQRIGFEMQAS